MVYFDNTAGWKKVFAYASNDTGYNKTWPGVPMTLGEDGCWYAEIDPAFTNIMFNNNSSASTQDLTIPTDGKNLFTYSTLIIEKDQALRFAVPDFLWREMGG